MAIAAELPLSDDPALVLAAPAPIRPLTEDDCLLRRIAEGDERAFRSLVERHVDKAYALALRILRNPTDAEDVVQDVMLKVWSNRGSWQEGRARFSTWLYRVVTNRCLDLCRRPRTSDIDAAPEMPDGKPDAVSSIHTGEVNLMPEYGPFRSGKCRRTAGGGGGDAGPYASGRRGRCAHRALCRGVVVLPQQADRILHWAGKCRSG